MTHKDFTIGCRVRLVSNLEPFLFGEILSGETGTITDVSDKWGDTPVSALVRLDRHFPQLDEWNNEIQVGMSDESGTKPEQFEKLAE